MTRNTQQRMPPLVAIALILLATSHAAGENVVELSRGQRWVRSNPYTLMALTIISATFHVDQYRNGAGLNTMLPWKAKEGLFEKAAAEQLPWHYHQRRHLDGLSDDLKQRFRRLYDTYPGCTGWMVWDEPQTLDMPLAAKTIAWLRKNYPDQLVYSNALPHGARSMGKYYGSNEFPKGYSYDDYLKDFVTIMKPDVMMYDAYIFKKSGKTSNIFRTAMPARQIALRHHLPYWTFVQSYSDPNRGYRMPSESDVRMQVFLHLALGYTGIAYFTYENQQGPAMVSPPPPGVINPIFYDVGRLNREVANLGQSLRFMTSTDVRIVPGPGRDALPQIPVWEPGAGETPEILDITIKDLESDDWKDLLIGFFTADDGEQYFMITNLWHGMDQSARQRQLSVTLKLAPGVKAVGRLLRETGRPELLAVPNGRLELVLPGGTGELLRLGDAEFPGL